MQDNRVGSAFGRPTMIRFWLLFLHRFHELTHTHICTHIHSIYTELATALYTVGYIVDIFVMHI